MGKTASISLTHSDPPFSCNGWSVCGTWSQDTPISLSLPKACWNTSYTTYILADLELSSPARRRRGARRESGRRRPPFGPSSSSTVTPSLITPTPRVNSPSIPLPRSRLGRRTLAWEPGHMRCYQSSLYTRARPPPPPPPPLCTLRIRFFFFKTNKSKAGFFFSLKPGSVDQHS